MRVALVHDYLNQMGGAEKVLLALHDIYPDAPIYTSIFDPSTVDDRFRHMDIRTSFMQRLPLVKNHHQPFLPLYPHAFERMDLREYDLVISDSSAFAKSVVTLPRTLHICYCHTPMRWAWNYEEYVERERLGKAARSVLPLLVKSLRSWDVVTSNRVDYFVANSPAVAERINKFYRRDAVYIPPPVDTSGFESSDQPGEYFLVVSRLVPYKRIDLAVQAFTMLGLPLKVVGSGRDEKRLKRMAGRNVTFLGKRSDAEVRAYLAGCRALIFPGEEDFGITPVEAQAAGRPVIAYAGGGALATVRDGVTGSFFHEQSVSALADSVASFNVQQYDSRTIRAHAATFDTRRFAERFTRFVDDCMQERQATAKTHMYADSTGISQFPRASGIPLDGELPTLPRMPRAGTTSQ